MESRTWSESARGRWQSALPDGRIRCDLCPRLCKLSDGQRAFCFVRQRVGDAIQLSTYGRATGFCIDPIEKKPLSHFLPGTAVLSFGTAGCNLGCRFCQNWTSSKAREVGLMSDVTSPAQIARAAVAAGCHSVAFTYNDPVIFAEFAIDTARACHEVGIKTVAVTAGYITDSARADFFQFMDAANVDLKAFSPSFYRELCAAEIEPVKATLRYLKEETSVWLEVTTLLIPGHNDSEAEIDALCTWVVDNLGPDVPLHFSAFHPDFRMRQTPRTPPETCRRARRQALSHGIRYVYSGNIRDIEGQSTYCPGCGQVVVGRDGYTTTSYRMEGGRCEQCGARIAGVFAGRPGLWGSKRARVHI